MSHHWNADLKVDKAKLRYVGSVVIIEEKSMEICFYLAKVSFQIENNLFSKRVDRIGYVLGNNRFRNPFETVSNSTFHIIYCVDMVI